MALLQPAPEVYELFDDILLMAESHVVYHGPKEAVLPFFERLGFRLPPRKGIGDFLQEARTCATSVLSPEAICTFLLRPIAQEHQRLPAGGKSHTSCMRALEAACAFLLSADYVNCTVCVAEGC